MIKENNSTNDNPQQMEYKQYSHVQPIWHFIILNFFSFGLYQAYWIYKSWHFVKARLNIKVSPAIRTVYSVFFLHSLFKKIYCIAKENGYNNKIPVSILFLTAILIPFLAFLPDPYWLLSLIAFIPYIPIVKALNFIFKKEQPNLTIRKYLSPGQMVFLILCIIFFVFAVIGTFKMI